MKKFKVLALALVIGTTSLFASNLVPDVPVKEIRNQVMDLFESPDFALENDVTINITFTFNSEGKIIVLSVNSKDRDILNYVHESMSNKKLNTPGELDRVFTMPLRLEI